MDMDIQPLTKLNGLLSIPRPTLRIQTPEWALPLLDKSRYKGAFGGRGSGKSHFYASLLIERHVLNPHTRSVCIREYQKSLIQSVKHLLEQKIKAFELESFFDIQRTEIRNRLGTGVILFQGMQNHTSETIQSLEGCDIAWVEEAQTLSSRSLKLLRPTIRKENSEIWFSWNPRYPSDPVDALLRQGSAPDKSIVVQTNYLDNPWVTQVLKDEATTDKKRDIHKYSNVWLGDYVSASDCRVFDNWVEEDFETHPDAHFRFGADWGFANDPTALVRCYQIGRKIYIDQEAVMVGCEIVDTPALFLTVDESERWPMFADSARPETISYMRQNGFKKIMKAVKGKDSVREGIEWLKSHTLVVHPRCKHMREEFRLYSYKRDPRTDEVLPLLEDKNNHLIDALRYACEGLRRASKKEPESLESLEPLKIQSYW